MSNIILKCLLREKCSFSTTNRSDLRLNGFPWPPNGFAETRDHAAPKTIETIQMSGIDFQLRARGCNACACYKRNGGNKCKMLVVAACACFEQDLARTTNKSSRESIACSSGSISSGPYQDSVYFRFIEGLRLWASSFL